MTIIAIVSKTSKQVVIVSKISDCVTILPFICTLEEAVEVGLVEDPGREEVVKDGGQAFCDVILLFRRWFRSLVAGRGRSRLLWGKWVVDRVVEAGGVWGV